MMETRRALRRFSKSLNIRFRPTYGAKDYADGQTTDLSGGGFRLDADDFKFIVYEYLELHVELPERDSPVVLFGDVVWKKQSGKRCLSGIKFRMKERDIEREAIERIFTSSGIPSAYIYAPDPGPVTDRRGGGSLPASAGRKESANKLGLTKEYTKDGSRCRVTFRLLRESVQDARHAAIVGDFNNWNASGSPMRRLENGDFALTMELDSGREYKFIYLLDDRRWENDRFADRYARNDSGTKTSVVIV